MSTTVLTIIRQLETSSSLVLRGAAALQALRRAIEVVVRESGITVVFDPTSEPALIDYLTVAGAQGLKGAAKGALIGLFIGALAGEPEVGCLVGAGLGGANGIARGVQQVQKGWRIHAVRTWDGTPLITVHVE